MDFERHYTMLEEISDLIAIEKDRDRKNKPAETQYSYTERSETEQSKSDAK